MEYLSILGSLLVVHLLALISPGPNVLIVTQTAMHRTRRAGVVTASGLAVAASIWSAAALFGLAAVFAGTPWLYNGLRIVGGVYLFYLGMGMLRHSYDSEAVTFRCAPVTTDWTAFRLGLFTSLSNPKALLFFAGLFTALLPPTLPLWIRVASVGIIFLDSLGWHSALAYFFSTEGARQAYNKAGRWLDRIAGLVLALLGLWLASVAITSNYHNQVKTK